MEIVLFIFTQFPALGLSYPIYLFRTSLLYGNCTHLGDYDGPDYEDRSTALFKQRLKECLEDCLELISEKAVDFERLKISGSTTCCYAYCNVSLNAPFQLALPGDGLEEGLLTTHHWYVSNRKPKYNCMSPSNQRRKGNCHRRNHDELIRNAKIKCRM